MHTRQPGSESEGTADNIFQDGRSIKEAGFRLRGGRITPGIAR